MPKKPVFLFIFLYYLLFATPIHAEILTSPSYKIRMGNFNMTSGMKSSASYSLTDTVGQTVAEYFSSSGYHVKAGFQYIYSLYRFSFVISNLSINFSLTPNSFSTASHTLTVTAPGGGYSISAIASNPLIGATSCNTSCTTTSAGVWTNANQNGWGYNVSGVDKASDFINATYFRPFPALSLGESPVVIASSSEAGQNRVSTITYQASAGGNQSGGRYVTSITYIATPSY